MAVSAAQSVLGTPPMATNTVDFSPPAKRLLACSRTIIGPASEQVILVGQVEMTPLHAGGADIGAGDHRPAVSEVGPDAIIVERRFHTLPHHQDLDAEVH